MDSEESQRSFLTWVRSARSTVATDPRDKIYTCFGFLPQDVTEGLNPSTGFQDCDLGILINEYDAPVHDVYASFVRAVVSASKKLNILSDCFQRSNLVSSTWIPDWTQPEIISVLGSEFQRTPKHWCAARDTTAVASFTGDSKVLTVKGVRVQKLWQKFSWDSLSNDKLQQLMDFFRICNESMLGRGISPDKAFDILWETFFVFFHLEKPANDREEQSFRSWMFRNLKSGATDRAEGESLRYDQELIYRGIDEAHYMGFTDKDCIGRFPFHSKKGDLICIILGSDAPIMLRPTGNYFELVGACYVDGLMYGEGLNGVDNGVLQLEEFEIH